MKTNKDMRKQLNKENLKKPKHLVEIPKDQWPDKNRTDRLRAWSSRYFLVQEFQEKNAIRISVNRSSVKKDGSWVDNISWDELMNIKDQLGYGESYAVEVYPANINIVNVANMRHLWVLPEALQIGWNRE